MNKELVGRESSCNTYQLRSEIDKLRHEDVIDNLLYGSSITNNLKLLKVNEELVKFVETWSSNGKHSYTRKTMIDEMLPRGVLDDNINGLF